VFVVRTHCQCAERLSLSRFLQVNSLLHSSIMPCLLISSSNCSAVDGSIV
jgi:hypothetical protein